MNRNEGRRGQERCYRAEWGGGRKERDVESPSAKLYVLGVNEGNQDAFPGEIDTVSCEKLMRRSIV